MNRHTQLKYDRLHCLKLKHIQFLEHWNTFIKIKNKIVVPLSTETKVLGSK